MVNASTDFVVDVLIGYEGYKSIESEWQQAAMKYGFHFLHFPFWYGAELNNKSSERVYFVTLRSTSGALTGVLPLERSTIKIGFITLSILQIYYPSEMGVNDFFATSSLVECWPFIVNQLIKKVDFFWLVRMQCVLEGGVAISLLERKHNIRWTHISKFLSFKQGFEQFISNYKSKFRNDLQKKIKKIEAIAPLSLSIYSKADDIEMAFAEFLAVESSGWKGASGTCIAKHPQKLEYYRYLARHYGELGLLRINILYLGKEPIAAQLGIQVGLRVCLLKIGYREDYSVYSPGALVLYKVIEHLAEQQQADSISFVTGVDWIDRWHPELRRVGIFYLTNGRLLSRATVWGLRWVIKCREAVNKKRKPCIAQ